MALALWARTAAGPNLAFIKGLGKPLKVWKDLLQQFKKSQLKTYKSKLISAAPPHQLAKEKCNLQTSHVTIQSRFFRSLFARTSSVTQAFRKAACKFASPLSSGSGGVGTIPLVSLIGLTLGVDAASLLNSNSEKVMLEMKGLFSGYSWQAEALPNPPKSLQDLDINLESLASGCEGAVYKAKVKPHIEIGTESEPKGKDEDFDLAVKAVFNYGAASNAESILKELRREYVPLHMKDQPESHILAERVGRLPPHPNIVDMPGIFEDDVLVTEEGLRKFPAAMPRRLDPENCWGHNKTLYVVMRRRSTHLRDYLSTHDVSLETRCLLLAQLLEGVSHLVQHGIAHRDLKADNILVDIPRDGGAPKLEICDFGCCLAEEDRSLQVSFPTEDMYKGGNSWLMAPEIATARPGKGKVLDYSKSDLWAAGTIAYEILMGENPFYPYKDNSRQQLSTWSYCDEELPILPDEIPEPIQRVVYTILSRNPDERPSASVAAAVVQMVVLQLGKQKSSYERHETRLPPPVWVAAQEREQLQWVLVEGFALLCQLVLGRDKAELWNVSSVMRFLFLSRLTYPDFKDALLYF